MPMAKIKYYIIAAIAAVFLIAGLLFVYFVSYAPVSLDEPAEVTLWYADDDLMTGNLPGLIRSFNNDEGEKRNIHVSLWAFESKSSLAEALRTAVENKGELPDAVLCDADLSAYLRDKGKLAETELYLRDSDTVAFDSELLKACTSNGSLVCLPVATESEVLLVNTQLCGESFESFEELCEAANTYYESNRKSFFTVSDYAFFFNSAMAQLGERFKAENPFDDENDNVKYIYDQLATAAFKRGFTAVKTDPAEMTAEGRIACAVIPAGDVMAEADKLTDDNISILPCPCMKDGEELYVRKVTGISILKSDKNTEKGTAIFIRWFLSEDINSAFVGYSGLTPASGTVKGGEAEYPELYGMLMDAVNSMNYKVYHPNADYTLKSIDFNSIMDNIMKKSLG